MDNKNNEKIVLTKEYENKVAIKIYNVSMLILTLGITIGLVGGLVVFAYTEEFAIITPAILLIIISLISSLLLTGLAEIIELLQAIKDK